MAVLRGVKDWWAGVSAAGKTILGVIVLVLVVSAIVQAFDHPSASERRIEGENRAFCRGLANRQAEASQGLHSIGGDWWTDRVNECLEDRD